MTGAHGAEQRLAVARVEHEMVDDMAEKMGPCERPASARAIRLHEEGALARSDEQRHRSGAPVVHRLAEALKLAYADRDAYYGDPKFNKIPAQVLLSKEYAAERRRLYKEAREYLALRAKRKQFVTAVRAAESDSDSTSARGPSAAGAGAGH